MSWPLLLPTFLVGRTNDCFLSWVQVLENISSFLFVLVGMVIEVSLDPTLWCCGWCCACGGRMQPMQRTLSMGNITPLVNSVCHQITDVTQKLLGKILWLDVMIAVVHLALKTCESDSSVLALAIKESWENLEQNEAYIMKYNSTVNISLWVH